MAQLVIAEAQSASGLTLVPTMPAKRMGQDRPLVRVNGHAQIFNIVEGRRRSGSRNGRRCHAV